MNDSSPEILMKVVGALASAILCLALASTGPVGAQIPPHDRHGMHTHDHSFKDAAKWSRMFDDPTRDEWQKPHQLIQVLALKPDAIVADIGAGTGYLSVRLAHMTPRGRVYGVDVEPDMVAYLRDRAAKSGLANLVAVQAKPDGLVLPEKVDMAVLLDVYHHIGDRRSYFRKLKDQLKPGGSVAIIDFRLDSPQGPPVSARLAPDKVRAEMAEAGYVLVQEHSFLPHQYFLVFKANPS
jgi:cyclopropane fatty-acyl-phospholipid synthase-like methyltransferase